MLLILISNISICDAICLFSGTYIITCIILNYPASTLSAKKNRSFSRKGEERKERIGELQHIYFWELNVTGELSLNACLPHPPNTTKRISHFIRIICNRLMLYSIPSFSTSRGKSFTTLSPFIHSSVCRWHTITFRVHISV